MSAGLNIAPEVVLPLNILVESTAVLAKKGAGKTSFGVVLAEEAHAAGVPVVIVDPKGDWWGIRAGADGQPDGGLPFPVFGGLHGDVPLESTSGAYVADLVRSLGLSALLDVSEFESDAARRRFLTAFADRIYRYDSKQPMTLILEEAHEYIPQGVTGEDATMVSKFARIVKQGRHKGLGVVMLTQRSASLNKNVLTQIDNLVVLQTTAPQDRDVVKSWIQGHGDEREILAGLPSMLPGEFWLWQPGRGEPVHARARMRTTYDSGATPKIGEAERPAATLADVDLGEVTAAMAASIEKVKGEDPKLLRARVAELEKQLAERPVGERVEVPVEVVREVEKVVEVPVISAHELGELRAIRDKIVDGTKDAIATIHAAIESVQKIENAIVGRTPQVSGQPSAVRPPAPSRVPAAVPPRPASNIGQRDAGDADVVLRAGARRMVETLGRMHPLRLTKAQWGTVSRMKTTSGTWSTYLGDIRRLGLLDENDVGYTLTEAGFDYLGGRPDPMTPEELQQHYRKILRAGAVRMLDAIMHWYPDVITRDDLGEETSMVTTSGTFSTYLGDLVRNGLVDKVDGGYVATDVLMKGAAA